MNDSAPEPTFPIGRGVSQRRRMNRRVRGPVVETDGGSMTDATELTTYTDERHGYSVAYPAGWSVEIDSSGVALDAPSHESVGAEVFVDNVDGTLTEYVESFFEALAADDHVSAVERLDGRDVWLASGQRGHILECSYVVDSPGERWRLAYLFALAGATGYTVGVDWEASEGFTATAAEILGSFALERTGD